MANSFQVRILILSREVEYLFCAWMNSEKSCKRQLFSICKQATVKLSLTYSFQKMLFIGQNLKHNHMASSFFELLIFFWLTLVNIDCLEFISRYIREIQSPKEANCKRYTNRYIVLLVSDIDADINPGFFCFCCCFFHVELKFLNNF